MIKLLLFLILMLGGEYSCFETQHELNLIKTLLTDYNKLARPDRQVVGNYKVYLKQIVSLDERNEIMTSSSNIFTYWKDGRLAWNDKPDYSNISYLYIPVSKIWMPDMVILNSADSDIFLKINNLSYVVVQPDGKVSYIYSASNLRTRCTMQVYKFPFEKNSCEIGIGSWALSNKRLDFNIDNSKINTTFYDSSRLWNLVSVGNRTSQTYDRFMFENYVIDETYIIYNLNRMPMSFMLNSVFRSLILNCLAFMAYWLPSGSKYPIIMTIFLTIGINSVRTISDIPVQSSYLPLISIYFLVSILFTLITFSWFILENIIRTEEYLPSFIQKILSSNRVNPEKQALDSKLGQCKACSMCVKCQVKLDKEKKEKKKKAEFEKCVAKINRAVFLLMLFIMLVINLTLWLIIAL